VVGVENEDGSGGDGFEVTASTVLPTDFIVVSTDPTPGGSLSWHVSATGAAAGTGIVHTEMTSPDVLGTTVADSAIEVNPPDLGQVQAFVNHAYLDLLGRPADPIGLDYWSHQIQSGALTRLSFAHILTTTPEWLGNLIDTRYQQLLQRAADPDGRAYYIGLMQGGFTEADLVSALTGSSEFFGLAGNDVPSFVDAVYASILHRAPDAGGRAFWIAQIGSGTPRGAVGRAVFDSLESRYTRVANLYNALLHRDPDPGGQAFWAGVVLTDGDVALASYLLASQEYYDRPA
jgi:hypothetical protein